MKNSEIKELLDLSVDQLYAKLGDELEENNEYIFGKKEKSLAEIIKSGKKWLSIYEDEIKGLICNNEKVQKILNSNETERNVALVSAIADLISSICISISPFTVASLLTLIGISKYCEK